MNKKVLEIIANINSLHQDEKKEVFKVLFQEPMSDKDLKLIRWAIDGIEETKGTSTKLDKVAEILDNAKRGTKEKA